MKVYLVKLDWSTEDSKGANHARSHAGTESRYAIRKIFGEIPKMTPFKTQAHIHSLGGAMDEITVLDMKEDGKQTIYLVNYRGVKCSAIFNPFNRTYYADNVYGRINE